MSTATDPLPDDLDTEEFKARVQKAYGSLRAASKAWGYDPSYLSSALRGRQPLREVHLIALRKKEEEIRGE
jgi:lambda repressor-like predicted transcriptional regulator